MILQRCQNNHYFNYYSPHLKIGYVIVCLSCNFDFEFHENQKSAFEIFIKTSAGQQPEGSNTKQRRRIFCGVTAVENFGKMHARNVKQILAEERRCSATHFDIASTTIGSESYLYRTKIKSLY